MAVLAPTRFSARGSCVPGRERIARRDRLAKRGGCVGAIDRSQPIAQNLHGLSDEQLLQLVVAGRTTRRGKEWDTATHAWRHLAARHYDRLRGLVVSFRFPGTADVRIGV